MTMETITKEKVSEKEDIYCPVCKQWLAGIFPDFSGNIAVQCSSCAEWVRIRVK